MKKRKIKLLFSIIILLFGILVHGGSLLSPSDVSVSIDTNPPDILIISPEKLNYNNSTPISVNYSVFDLSHDSTWYSLNGGQNISIYDNFSLDLPEGKYNLVICANDSFSRFNCSEINFTINNSLSFCGDGFCNNDENCFSCPEDCGSCPHDDGSTGSSSSSGKVGGGIKEDLFILDKSEIVTTLKLGENKIESINLKNLQNDELTFEISLSPSLDGLVKIRESSLILKVNQNKSIELEIIAPEDRNPGVYTGKIIFTTKGYSKEIFFSIGIESKHPLFDIELKILENNSNLYPGDEIFGEITIIDVGESGLVDVVLEKGIKNSEGEFILENEKTFAINGKIVFIESLRIPEGIKPGRYSFYAKAYYNGSSAVTSQTFLIQSKFSLFNLIIVVVIIFLILTILLIKKTHKKELIKFKSKYKKKRL